MTAAADPVKLMKQEVGRAAANLVKSGSIVGLGTGSTTAYTIQFLVDRPNLLTVSFGIRVIGCCVRRIKLP